MPVRATTRGAARTPLERDCDVLVCGASFAGLAIARELAGAGAQRARDRSLRDRRAPDFGLRDAHALAERDGPAGLASPDVRRAGRAHAVSHLALVAAVVVLDVRLPRAVRADVGAGRRRRAGVRDGDRHRARRVYGAHRPRLADGAAGRRWRSAGGACCPTGRRSSRPTRVCRAVWRCTLRDEARRWSCGWTRATCAPATPGASRPPTSCASASARSGRHTTSRQPTVRLAGDLGLPAQSYQGNWIPHQLRAAVEDGVFFAGDSAGHCLPLTAEGIRTALCTSAWPAGASCAPCSKAAARASWRFSATAPSRPPTRASSAGCCARSRPSVGSRRAAR